MSVDALFQAPPAAAGDPTTALAAVPAPRAVPDLPPEPPHRYVVRRANRRVIEIEGGGAGSSSRPRRSTAPHRYVNLTGEDTRAVCARIDGRPRPA